MKKIFFIFLLPAILSFKVGSNSDLIFKFKYHPETKYRQTIQNKSVIIIKYMGSQKFLEGIKSKGLENPMLKRDSSIMETTFSTGKVDGTGKMPIVIDFLNPISIQGKSVVPAGTKIFGKCQVDSMPIIDSISGSQMDNDFKNAFLKSFQNILTQFNFPEKKMSIGETFDRELPFKMPIAGFNLDMNIVTHYKLLSISNQIAKFDVKMEYVVKTTETKFEINASGTGSGSLLYDITNNFYIENNTNMKFIMKCKINEEAKFEVQSNMDLIQNCKIESVAGK